MPNTKSAERRTRSSARVHARNNATEARLRTLEARFLSLLKGGKPEERTTAFKNIASALDKAAKTGVIHKSNANRKKSRLAARAKAA